MRTTEPGLDLIARADPHPLESLQGVTIDLDGVFADLDLAAAPSAPNPS